MKQARRALERARSGRTHDRALEHAVQRRGSSAVALWRSAGWPVLPENKARLSPFGHEHIHVRGRASFPLPEAVAGDELRALGRGGSICTTRESVGCPVAPQPPNKMVVQEARTGALQGSGVAVSDLPQSHIGTRMWS